MSDKIIVILDDKPERTSGCCSAISFDSPKFRQAMNSIFDINTNKEHIVQFGINELGINVTIEQEQANEQL